MLIILQQSRMLEEERKAKEAKESEEREEQMRKRKSEERQKRKERLKQSLPPEPENSDNVAHLIIRLTDGSRLQRRFRKNETVGV